MVVVGVAQEQIQEQRASFFFEEFFAEPDDAGARIENDPVLSSNTSTQEVLPPYFSASRCETA